MDYDHTEQLQALASAPPGPPPAPPAPPTRSAWSVLPRSIGAGAAGVKAAVAESAGSVPEDDYERRRRDAAGIPRTDFKAAAQQAREFERSMRPDPATAGLAENVIYGLGRALTSAALGAVVAGPAGAAATVGTAEGATTFDDLLRQGVDRGTAGKVAAVTGVVTGGGAALPLAGTTLAKTAGLYALGGPGAFVAQQAATREILGRASYGELAKQYDPMDPTGLALALIPVPFAAWAVRANLRAGKAPRETSPAAAPAAEGAPVVPAADPAPAIGRDDIDAAMVHNLTLQRDLAPVRERQELQQAWDRVHGDPLGNPDHPLVRLTPHDIEAVRVERGPARLDGDGVTVRAGGYGLVKFIWKHGPESGKGPEAAVTRADLEALPTVMREKAPRVEQVNGVDQLTWAVDQPDGRRVVYGTSRFVQDGEHHLVTVHVDEGGFTPASPQREMPQQPFGQEALQASDAGTADRSFSSTQSEGLQGQGPTLPPETPTAAAAKKAMQEVQGGRAVEDVAANLPDDVQNLLIGLREAGTDTARAGRMLSDFQRTTAAQPGRSAVDIAADVVEAARTGKTVTPEPAAAVAPKTPEAAAAESIRMRIGTLEAAQPDMVVRIDADGAPVTLQAELARIRQEAAAGTDTELGGNDAHLLQVAADCALSLG